MKKCDKCCQQIIHSEEKKCDSRILCEDCYIDVACEKNRKASYIECGHSFMLRLKPGFDNRRLLK